MPKQCIGRKVDRAFCWYEEDESMSELKCPYLESDRVLLHLLGALPLVCVWRLDTQIQSQLSPCLDLLGIEFAYQLEEGPGAEGVAVALGRGAEQLQQLGGVDGGGEVGVAVQYEGGVGVVDGVVGHIARGRVAVRGLILR